MRLRGLAYLLQDYFLLKYQTRSDIIAKYKDKAFILPTIFRGMLMSDFYFNLVKVYRLINEGSSIDTILDSIYTSFRTFLDYDRIGIALLDNQGKIFSYAVRSKKSTFLNPGYAVNVSETSLYHVIKNKKPRIIDQYTNYLESVPQSKSTPLILKEGIQSSIAYPLTSAGESIGVLLFASSKTNAYHEDHLEYIKMISENISIALEKNLLADDLILGAITGFAKIVEAKDSDTGLHIERMQNYSKIIAKSLSKMNTYKDVIDFRYINDIFRFSPVHDIGKAGIADGILLKPGKLTPEEFEVMKMHTTIGAGILTKANYGIHKKERHLFDMGIEIALGHHERFDGRGYPCGISGKNIPLSARIVIAADILDALTSKRVYKSAFDINTSMQLIKDESDKIFDPDIVSAMLEAQEKILMCYEQFNESVDLSNI